MSESVGLADKVLFLPQLLNRVGGTETSGDWLAEWTRLFHLEAGGFQTPVQSVPHWGWTNRKGESKPNTISLSSATIQALLNTPQNRVVTTVEHPQRRLARIPTANPSVLWAEKAPGNTWTATEEAFLATTACLLGSSSFFQQRPAHNEEQTKIIQRLNDGAILAGRMAHDFDNLWTGILGFADLTLPLLEADSSAQQYVGEISQVGQRGVQMTHQLHMFSRSGAIKPLPSLIPPVLAREQNRLRSVLGTKIQLEISLTPQLPAVFIDASAVQVILGQLLDNAVEALSQGGNIHVEASMIELQPNDLAHYFGCPKTGSYVQVRITDNGPGIRDELKRRLFLEPFVTTKVRHRGLGLAIVYRTLYVHQGGLLLESENGRGTTVSVVLPIATQRGIVQTHP